MLWDTLLSKAGTGSETIARLASTYDNVEERLLLVDRPKDLAKEFGTSEGEAAKILETAKRERDKAWEN